MEDARVDPHHHPHHAEDEGPMVRLEVRWHGTPLTLEARLSATVGSLKQQLADLTGVAPHHQKLIGLMPRGRNPSDDVRLPSPMRRSALLTC